MSKIPFGFVLVVIFCGCAMLNAAPAYEYNHRFALKKDELGFVFINRKEVTKKATVENPNNDYLLKFRWTLFANDQLFLLVNYRGHPYQFIMKKTYPLESVTVPLLPDGENKMDSRVLARIFFNDFDQSNREAILDIFIEDNQERIQVEFKPKKN